MEMEKLQLRIQYIQSVLQWEQLEEYGTAE